LKYSAKTGKFEMVKKSAIGKPLASVRYAVSPARRTPPISAEDEEFLVRLASLLAGKLSKARMLAHITPRDVRFYEQVILAKIDTVAELVGQQGDLEVYRVSMEDSLVEELMGYVREYGDVVVRVDRHIFPLGPKDVLLARLTTKQELLLVYFHSGTMIKHPNHKPLILAPGVYMMVYGQNSEE